MSNLFFLKIEIIVFFVSILYFSYYIIDRLLLSYLKVKKIIKPRTNKKIKEIENRKKKQEIKEKEKKKLKSEQKTAGKKNKKIKTKVVKKLSQEEKERVIEIIKKIKIFITKGFLDATRGLIIEGLAIDKHNRDLNLFLAQIYEKEEKYKNAELIYKDLIRISTNDYEVKKILAFNLAIQNKLEESLLMYENIFKNKKYDEDIIDMLSDLTYDMKNYKKCIKYINLYLKIKPRDVEKMFMKSTCLEMLGKIDDALIIYKKILQIQPYNTQTKEKIKELEV